MTELFWTDPEELPPRSDLDCSHDRFLSRRPQFWKRLRY